MLNKKVIFYLLSLCFLINWALGESTLRQIHVLFRHGERTPNDYNLYPNDPYLNDSWYPYGRGALTNKGKHRTYLIGKKLREAYDEFLGHIYKPEKLYARSTSYDRTQMSLLSVLAGLWEPVTVQTWRTGLDWQPIPYDRVPYKEDKLLGFPSCTEFAEVYENIKNSKEMTDFLKENAEMIKVVNNYTGLHATTTYELFELHNGLQAEKQEKPLPSWTLEMEPFLKKAANFEYKVRGDSNTMNKEIAGPLIKKIIEDTEKGIESNKFSPRLYLYSAHEYNVAHALASLKIFDPKVPPFGSYLVFEVHQTGTRYSIKVLYAENASASKPQVLPGCEEFCDLEKFKELMKDVIPEKPMC